MCPEILDEVHSKPSEASDSVARLLEQVMSCPSDETLMDVAKESGKQLYSNMPHEEKVEKINTMVSITISQKLKKKVFMKVITEN